MVYGDFGKCTDLGVGGEMKNLQRFRDYFHFYRVSALPQPAPHENLIYRISFHVETPIAEIAQLPINFVHHPSHITTSLLLEVCIQNLKNNILLLSPSKNLSMDLIVGKLS